MKAFVDFVVIGMMRQRRRIAVPLILIFIANQIYFTIKLGPIVLEISLIGWLGALAFIEVVYGLYIRLAFATRPIRR